jgi:aminopeptidase
MELERELAQKVVQTCLRIRPGEIVHIETWQHTLSLAEEVTLACARAGARTSIQLLTDRLFSEILGNFPDETLKVAPKDMISAYEHVDALINLGGPEDPDVFDQAKPEKMNALADAFQPLNEVIRRRKIRTLNMQLGNCTPHRARKYGIDYQGWLESMMEALSVDFRQLSKRGSQLARKLSNCKNVHITTPSGTDLAFELVGRPGRVLDGIIDEADLEIGAYEIELPTGSVVLAPDEYSASGSVVIPTMPFWGMVVKDQRWVFENGRLVEHHARENGQMFEEMLSTSKGDKDRFGLFGIGINPGADPTEIGLMNWIVEVL